jgi:hypothetical protein
MPTQTAGDTGLKPPTTDTALAPSEPPRSSGIGGLLRGGSRRARIIAASVLTAVLVLGTAWAVGALGGPGHRQPAPTHPAAATGPDTAVVSPAPSASGVAPQAGTGPAAPGAARSGQSKVGVTATNRTPSNGWKTRDQATLPASSAAYFIAGTAYGDPSGSQDRYGVVTMTSTNLAHLKRGGRSAASLTQLEQAIQAVGGKMSVSRSKTGGGKASFTMPAGHSIILSLGGWVRIDGHDAFGLRKTSSGWTSTATGSQVRAFLAGYIEGEGSVKGLIGDDPSAAHLAFVAALMATPQAYSVRTVLDGTHFHHLYVASPADFPKVQAYPFLTYVRVPGGKP